MKTDLIAKLHGDFERLVQREEDSGVEFWMARDLQEILGYAKWENFAKVLAKARSACQNSGYNASDHFLDIRKMVDIGSGTKRAVDDIMLTRYACYLIAQNGDPGKAIDVAVPHVAPSPQPFSHLPGKTGADASRRVPERDLSAPVKPRSQRARYRAYCREQLGRSLNLALTSIAIICITTICAPAFAQKNDAGKATSNESSRNPTPKENGELKQQDPEFVSRSAFLNNPYLFTNEEEEQFYSDLGITSEFAERASNYPAILIKLCDYLKDAFSTKEDGLQKRKKIHNASIRINGALTTIRSKKSKNEPLEEDERMLVNCLDDLMVNVNFGALTDFAAQQLMNLLPNRTGIFELSNTELALEASLLEIMLESTEIDILSDGLAVLSASRDRSDIRISLDLLVEKCKELTQDDAARYDRLTGDLARWIFFSNDLSGAVKLLQKHDLLDGSAVLLAFFSRYCRRHDPTFLSSDERSLVLDAVRTNWLQKVGKVSNNEYMWMFTQVVYCLHANESGPCLVPEIVEFLNTMKSTAESPEALAACEEALIAVQGGLCAEP